MNRTLEEIEADARASTECVHVHSEHGGDQGMPRDYLEGIDGDDVVWGLGDGHDGEADMNEQDAAFFSRARGDVLDLVAEVRRLRARQERSRSLLNWALVQFGYLVGKWPGLKGAIIDDIEAELRNPEDAPPLPLPAVQP